MSVIEKNNPIYIKAWTFYDWANSVYALVITTTIFPVYYGVITHVGTDNEILINGLKPETVFDLSLAISFLIVALGSPILSAIADASGKKLQFLKIFCYIGATACIGLAFMTPENIHFGLFCHIVASIGYWGSLVFYNSYLPEIVSEDKMDAVSAEGFIQGYIGSVTLLIICLLLIEVVAPEDMKGLYTRLSFVLTGLWWMGFAQYTFSRLPKIVIEKKVQQNVLQKAKRELILVIKEIKKIQPLQQFLFSFFFYSLGMQTIIMMSTLYAKSEAGMSTSQLIILIVLIQFEAIFGAWLFQLVSKKFGNQRALLLGIFIWIVFTFLVYFLNKNSPSIILQFYLIGSLAGVVVGGIQAISRSTYSKLLPETEDTTTFFSFYDVFEKISLVVGLIVYGLVIENVNTRTAMLAMGFSFVIAFILMLRLNNRIFKTA